METAFTPATIHTNWKVLYKAAINEPDKTLGSIKVAEAENAILARGRELFYDDGTLEEKEAIEDALYILRALRSSWRHTGSM